MGRQGTDRVDSVCKGLSAQPRPKSTRMRVHWLTRHVAARCWQWFGLGPRCLLNAPRGRKLGFHAVKWFNADKGYGFISQDGGDDLFVHFSEIQTDGFKTLEENAHVEFTVAVGNNGKSQATMVHTI